MSARWFFRPESLPEGARVEAVPSWAMENGRERLRALAEIVGAAEAERVARGAGPFEIDDELAREVALAGARLGEGGSIPCLDRARWADGFARPRYEDWRAQHEGRILGLALAAAARAKFALFVDALGSPPASPVELIELARHYFADEEIPVVVTR